MQSIQYNPCQQQAIDAEENNIVITAPPGSGKTATIVGAIAKYIEHHEDSHIVAVTFTKKAAEDLMARIEKVIPTKNYKIEVSTIHSWSYRQLQYFAGIYNFAVTLLQEDMIKDILLRICRKRNQYYINQFMLYSYIMGNFNLDIDDSLIRTFEQINQTYINFKRKNELYDFTDLPLYLSDILDRYNETINNIDALFVDEFQDVDDIQLSIFDRVNADKKVYIGDRKQSIYIFRGASEEAFDNLQGFTDYYLDTNYRSYQEIMDYSDTVNAVASSALYDEMNFQLATTIDVELSPVHCERGNGGEIYCIPTVGKMVNMSIHGNIHHSEIGPMLRKLIADKGTQILCRANKQVKKIKSYDIQNVSTIHQAKGLEYDNVIVTSFDITTEEEKNIAYVAMTRAKNKLIVIDYETLLYYITNNSITHSNKLF